MGYTGMAPGRRTAPRRPRLHAGTRPALEDAAKSGLNVLHTSFLERVSPPISGYDKSAAQGHFLLENSIKQKRSGSSA